MKKLRIVPANTAFNFIGRRVMAFAFSGALILASLGLAFGNGLNLGIDFLGGILLLLIGIDMVFARPSGSTSTTTDEAKEAELKKDISVYRIMEVMFGLGI